MKKLLTIIFIALVGSNGYFVYRAIDIQKQADSFGQAIPTVVALFETSLQSAVTSSATSMTLVKGTDKRGTSLSGTIGFVIDEGTASEEFVVCSVSATALTSCVRGVDVQDGKTAVTALQFSHRRGASIKVTNYPQLAILSRILNAQESVPSKLYYPSNQNFSTASSSAIVDKNYVDNLAIAGCANGSLTVQGCAEMATSAEIDAGTGLGGSGARLFINPSYLASSSLGQGIPSLTQKAALNGTLASPSATNKFLTLNNIWGKQYSATQKLIGFTLTASAQGDILYRNSSGNYVNLAASSSGNFLMTNGAGTNPTYQGVGSGIKVGIVTLDTSSTTTTTIAHGLGRVPKVVNLNVKVKSSGGNVPVTSVGYFTAAGQSSAYFGSTANNYCGGTEASLGVHIEDYNSTGNCGAQGIKGTVAVDATNITITWATLTSGAGVGTVYLIWEAK